MRTLKELGKTRTALHSYALCHFQTSDRVILVRPLASRVATYSLVAFH